MCVILEAFRCVLHPANSRIHTRTTHTHAHTYLALSGIKSLSAFELAAIFDELHHTAATGIGKKKGSWGKEQERGIEVAFYADTAEKPLELLAEPYHNPTAALRAALVWQIPLASKHTTRFG